MAMTAMPRVERSWEFAASIVRRTGVHRNDEIATFAAPGLPFRET
jgi:hypothetical protein